MKDSVKYPMLPYAEYRGRVDRAKTILAEHDMDAMVLFSPENWRYYGGFTDAAQMHNRVWRSGLIVCQDRDPVAVVHPAFVTGITCMSYVEELRVWSDEENILFKGLPRDFYDLFFDTLDELDLSGKTLGFETGPEIHTYLSFDEYDMIRTRLAGARLVSADAAIFAQRSIKTAWEQDLMREGAQLACDCVRAAFEAIAPGVNERQLHNVYWGKAAELGMIEAPYLGSWTCFSANPTEPMGVHRWITGPVDRILQPGDVGICDGGPMYRGYQFDFQRSFCVGEPPEKLRQYHEIGTEAHLETIAAIRPGVRIADLYQTSLAALEKRDYPEGHIISFIGHQEGLAHHEPPWVMADEEAVLREGMVLAIEIGAFDPDMETFGAMPEDLLLVTADGCENLTAHLSHDLWVAA